VRALTRLVLAREQAAVLAVISGLAVVLTRAGGSRVAERVGLVEGWEGWLQEFAAPFGFGGAEAAAGTHARLGQLKASVVPTGTMNLAAQSSKPAMVRGSGLATWVATGVENFARACGKDRDQPCSTDESTVGDGAAKWAVENGNQTSYVGDSCTATRSQAGPWWKVNFGRQIRVTGVRIFGPTDKNLLDVFNVYVGNHNGEPDKNAACAVNQPAPAGPNYDMTVSCTSPLKGTYLYIQVPSTAPEDKVLSLCEVQVRGEELPPDEGGYDPWGISNQGDPRPDQLPIGASRNTWANIVNNKKNTLWCVEHFEYLGQRERCIHDFTSGGFLAKDPRAAQAMLAAAPIPHATS
jgi:hypothetical protein